MLWIAKALRDLLVFTSLWILTVSGGVFLVLILLNLIGYLPYSDRPGPGWQAAHLPSVEELGFFFGWALSVVAPLAAYWGALLFIFVRTLGCCGTPVLALRIVGGIICGFLGLLIVSGSGWYIAISAAAVYATGTLAASFGIFLLPRFRGSARPWRKSIRIACAGTALAAFVALISYPFWPRGVEGPQVDVIVVRVAPGSQSVRGAQILRTSEASLLESLGVQGVVQLGAQSASVADGHWRPRMLIVARGPIRSQVELREPREGDVAYVQDGDKWKMYPPEARTTPKTISLRPSSDDHYLDFRLNRSSTRNWQTSYWSPPIN